MPEFRQALIDFAAALAETTNSDDAFSTFEGWANKLGLPNYSFAAVSTDLDGHVTNASGKTNLEDDYISQFIQNGFYEKDYIAALVSNGASVVDWGEVFAQFQSKGLPSVWSPALDFALQNGFSVGRTFQMSRYQTPTSINTTGISFIAEKGASSREFQDYFDNGQKFFGAAAQVLETAIDVGAVAKDYHRLTDREYEVLKLLAEGLQVQQIADRLNLADRTAAHHLATMRQKIGARTPAHAVAAGFRLGLL